MAVAQMLPALRGTITEADFLRLPENGRKRKIV